MLAGVYKSLAFLIFNLSKNTITNINSFISNINLASINYMFFYVSLFILTFFFMQKMMFFLINGNQYRIIGYWKENRGYIASIVMILLISLYPSEILKFTFGFWSSLFNEQELFNLLDTSEMIKNENIGTMIVFLSYALSALFIAIQQIAEVLLLALVLIFSPLILIASLFNRNISTTFIKTLVQRMISPISQTIIMYFFVQFIIPPLIVEGETTTITRLLIIISGIFMSYKASQIMSEWIFIKEKEKTPVFDKYINKNPDIILRKEAIKQTN